MLGPKEKTYLNIKLINKKEKRLIRTVKIQRWRVEKILPSYRWNLGHKNQILAGVESNEKELFC